jgi:hypothetical protein
MQTYSDRALHVASESGIAVQVLLSSGNDDIELISLKPVAAEEYIDRATFKARQLRAVGVIGLAGVKPLSAFRKPLTPPLVDAIAAAFLEYVRVLLGGSFAEQAERAEIAELERLYALPSLDTRWN